MWAGNGEWGTEGLREVGEKGGRRGLSVDYDSDSANLRIPGRH